jgi:hypothetical protein
MCSIARLPDAVMSPALHISSRSVVYSYRLHAGGAAYAGAAGAADRPHGGARRDLGLQRHVRCRVVQPRDAYRAGRCLLLGYVTGADYQLL